MTILRLWYSNNSTAIDMNTRLLCIIAALFALFQFNPAFSAEGGPKSICYGTTSNGYLKNAVRLPESGDNFETYHWLGWMLERTYVHSTVYRIVMDSYEQLSEELPGNVFVYGETGFKEGGQFKPHKTHRNGLSVDFMTPVKRNGKPDTLPITVFNKFGYDIEFDSHGQYEGYSIDYDALAAHIVALHKAAIKNGVDIWRVIFYPKLQPNLFNTKYGSYLRKNIQFSSKQSWYKHDNHYHVDFSVPCR